MSLGIVIKGPEGIVLAADSRLTVTATLPPNPAAPGVLMQLPVNFDNSTKLLTFNGHHRWIGAVTFGDATIGQANDLRTAQSFLSAFELTLPEERLTVAAFAQSLSDFFMNEWNTRMPQGHVSAGMSFVIGGFDADEAYGSMYELNIPNTPVPVEQMHNDFGLNFGGQKEITERLMQGYDAQVLAIITDVLGLTPAQVASVQTALAALQISVPLQLLPLQDCIDLAVFLIRTTTSAQSLSIGLRGVGGAIDVAVITQQNGIEIIQRKGLTADKS